MSLKDLVINAAPTIATVLGGKFAGTAVSLLEQAFGVKSDQLEDTITNDPNAQIKLKELELTHAEAMQKLTVDDSVSARNREIQITQITGKRDWVPSALAFFFVAIYAAIQMTAIYLPGNSDDVISARVQDIILMIASYYFGNIHRNNPQS